MNPTLPILAGAAGLGAGLAAWGAFHPASQLFGPTLRFTGRKGAIALTFDDGPNPAATPRLLDLLEQNGVRGTFFLIGNHVRACPQLAAEIAARGHVIGNHTDTHPSLTWLSTRDTAGELQRCQEAIERAAGRAPQWMRPPYGYRGPQTAAAVRQAGLRGVAMWSVWARDWRPQPPQPVIERLRKVRGGDIVVLHDGAPQQIGADRSHTLAALEYWLPRWKNAGLEFVTVDEIAAPK